MTTNLLGRMMIALVISALSWVGMSMRTDAQQQRQQDQFPVASLTTERMAR